MSTTKTTICDCGCGSVKVNGDGPSGWVHISFSIENARYMYLGIDLAPGCWNDVGKLMAAIESRLRIESEEQDEKYFQLREAHDKELRKTLERLGMWSSAARVGDKK